MLSSCSTAGGGLRCLTVWVIPEMQKVAYLKILSLVTVTGLLLIPKWFSKFAWKAFLAMVSWLANWTCIGKRLGDCRHLVDTLCWTSNSSEEQNLKAVYRNKRGRRVSTPRNTLQAIVRNTKHLRNMSGQRERPWWRFLLVRRSCREPWSLVQHYFHSFLGFVWIIPGS